MTPLAWSLMLSALALAAADWFFVFRKARGPRWFTKPAVMAALIGAALALHPVSPAERAWFVAAALLGLGGDIALHLEGERAFVAGLIAFLVGHLAYIGGFRTIPINLTGFVIGALIAAASAALLLRPVIAGLRRGGRSRLVAPIVAYVVVISLMLMSAFGSAVWLAAGGAFLFFASDAELAWDRFVEPIRRGRLINIVLYQSGQACLLLSLASTTIR